MCANWVDNNREVSPDRYQLDNVGLQLNLGLPLQILGVSLMNDFNNRPRGNGNRGRGGNRRNNKQNQDGKVEIQETCDGIPIRKLYVTNISPKAERFELKEIFGRFGKINQIYLGVSRNDTKKKFAFITFDDPKAAARVLAQNRFPDGRGRSIFVAPADSWHQPRELPDGTIDWRPRKPETKQDGESEEEDEQTTEEVPTQIETEIVEGSLNMLNDDCLLHIFSFMSFREITAVERVCKRWQALSYRMWRCLHELNFQKDKEFSKILCNTKVLDQFLKRCGPSLTTLDLTTNNHVFSEHTLAVVAKHCQNLEVLRVNDIAVGNRCLAHLGRSCPRLKQLVMDGCEKVTDGDLNSLLPKCKDLTLLDLTNISEFTGKCLANVTGPVTSLRLCELRKMVDPQVLIKGLQNMSATLESLSLSSCNPVMSLVSVRDIVATVPNLSTLVLSHCTMHFEDRSLISLGNLKNLTSLNLSFNNGVSDKALYAIIDGCEELTTLNLSGCGTGCAGILSEQGLSMLARLRNLRHLNISYLDITTNTALKNFTARNSKLKSLVCRGCPELNDEGTEPVVTLCNELELFDVSGCVGVSVKTAETALTSAKMRTNQMVLRLIVGGTLITPSSAKQETSPLLKLDFRDLSEDHLRPDFIDDMFFPPSDSDEEDDLDHLCERIAFMIGGDVWEDLIESSDYEGYFYDSDDSDASVPFWRL